MRWLILSLALAAPLSAQQVATGSIEGTVVDPDGRVARVQVRAVNVATNVAYNAAASATGQYSLSQLPPGTYQVTIPLTLGFKSFVRDGLLVAPGQTLRLDIHLEEGVTLNTLGDGRDFFAARATAAKPPPTGPAPRMPDGRPDLSGFWSRGPGGAAEPPPEGLPWAEAVVKERMMNNLKDMPTARCLPGGLTQTAAQGKFVQTPGLLVILNEFPGNTRQIFLDGRQHPKDREPTWLGHSVGRWEGETLVVDTVGFNDKSWLSLVTAYPHTEMMHIVERYRRPDLGHLVLEMTVEDPGALKKPWLVRRNANLDPTDEIMEFICVENEKDLKHVADK